MLSSTSELWENVVTLIRAIDRMVLKSKKETFHLLDNLHLLLQLLVQSTCRICTKFSLRNLVQTLIKLRYLVFSCIIIDSPPLDGPAIATWMLHHKQFGGIWEDALISSCGFKVQLIWLRLTHVSPSAVHHLDSSIVTVWAHSCVCVEVVWPSADGR